MGAELHNLVDEALALAKDRGISQKELAARSTLSEVAISRLKKAGDAKFSTLLELGKSIGKKLIWVDDSDLASLVQKGDLF
ncbi:MAG: hypothetical protein GXP22_03885 [Gammaproteobacteria bacterium]|nr:hypothetical protein [Gammaproteobacteria bacterium]